MGRVDLHIHTSYSIDSDFTPGEIIKKAKEKDLSAIAITDHNTTAGIEEALNLAAGDDLEVIPGLEVDTRYGDDRPLHILGYYLDWRSPRIKELSAKIKEAQIKQFYQRVEKLQEMGFEITPEEVLEIADNERPVAAVIAKVLLSKPEYQDDERLKPYLIGDRSDQPYFNFFLDYFKFGKEAYVSCWNPDSKEVVKLIRELGGVAVLAHPGSALTCNDEDIIDDLINAGLQGMEVYSTYHNQEETDGFLKLAKKKELVITAGSDFHGELKPEIELGGVEKNYYKIVEDLKGLRDE